MKLIRYILALSLLTALASFAWMSGTLTAPGPNSQAISGTENNPCFLALSDIHLNDEKPMSAAYNGSGDSGFDLWDAAKSKVSQIIKDKKPSFIVLLGDLPMHHVQPADSAHSKKEISAVINSLKELAAQNNIPLIYVPGNNDIPGHHNGTFSESNFKAYTNSQDDWAMTSGKVTFPTDAKPTDLGYYAVYPLADRKLRVIVLNTVEYLSKTNDPSQLVWLRGQLKNANALKEKVLIVMHVPPGSQYDGKPMWKKADVCLQQIFIRCIAQYGDIICGILTSHTHKEGIKVYQDARGRLIDIGFSIPGIAPGHGNYPAMTLISYAPATYMMEDVMTYYHTYSADSSQKGVKVSQWGNESISLSKDVANKPAGMTLLDFIRALPADSVLAVQKKLESMLNEAGPKRYDNPKVVPVTDGCE